MKQLIINFNSELSEEETIKEVLRQIKEGFKTGVNPDWDLVNVIEEKEIESLA